MKPKQIKDHTGILSSIFAIILGLIVGLIILFLCNPKQALPGFATMLSGAFTHGAKGPWDLPLRQGFLTSELPVSLSWVGLVLSMWESSGHP